MKVCIQRVKKSSVKVNNRIIGQIDKGLNILVGFTEGDNSEKIKYLSRKIANLRIFDDEKGIMNKSITDISGKLLCISQFTLYSDTTNGNRPSYQKAMAGPKAKLLYDEFIEELNKYAKTEQGQFGADMEVNIVNDGPVTIIIEK